MRPFKLTLQQLQQIQRETEGDKTPSINTSAQVMEPGSKELLAIGDPGFETTSGQPIPASPAPIGAQEDELAGLAPPDELAGLPPPDADQFQMKPEEPGKLESFGRGVVHGGSLGAEGPIAGGVAGLMQLFGHGNIGPNGKPISALDAYRQYRDEQVAGSDAARKANPISYDLGGMLGVAPLAPLLPNSVAGSAALGGLSSLASSHGDITKGELMPWAEGMLGAATGGAAAKYLPGAIKASSEYLGNKAQQVGLWATRKMLGENLPEGAARAALEHGIRPGGTTRGAASRLGEALGPAGKGVDEAVKGAEAKGISGPGREVVANLRAAAQKEHLRANHEGRDVLNEAADRIEGLIPAPEPIAAPKAPPVAKATSTEGKRVGQDTVSIPGANKAQTRTQDIAQGIPTQPAMPQAHPFALSNAVDIKRTYQKMGEEAYQNAARGLVGKSKPVSVSGAAKMQAAGSIQKSIEDAVERQNPEEAAKLIASNQAFHNIKTAQSAAQREADPWWKELLMSVPSVGTAQLKARGPSTVAAGAYGLGQALRGPNAGPALTRVIRSEVPFSQESLIRAIREWKGQQ